MELIEEKKNLNYFRAQIIDSVYASGNGHIGGALSCVDLIYMIYKYCIEKKKKGHRDRDRFILSKGHACLAQYCVLAHYDHFSKKELKKFRSSKGMLEGHPETSIPGIETASGSLGIGASVSVGIAKGLLLKKSKAKVYCIISDGESQEGIIWEASMFASHYNLGNLTFILDYNNLQQDGKTSEIMNIQPISSKWKSFGWAVKTIDGHDLNQIKKSLLWSKKNSKKPKLIIAKTTKGKGVSFMENSLDWHGTSPPTSDQYSRALEELKIDPKKMNY